MSICRFWGFESIFDRTKVLMYKWVNLTLLGEGRGTRGSGWWILVWFGGFVPLQRLTKLCYLNWLNSASLLFPVQCSGMDLCDYDSVLCHVPYWLLQWDLLAGFTWSRVLLTVSGYLYKILIACVEFLYKEKNVFATCARTSGWIKWLKEECIINEWANIM